MEGLAAEDPMNRALTAQKSKNAAVMHLLIRDPTAWKRIAQRQKSNYDSYHNKI